MHYSFACAAPALALLGCLLLQPGPASAQPMPFGTPGMRASQSELIQNLLPSVVKITIRKNVAPVRPGTNAAAARDDGRAYGSGFIIDASGVIATNYHVVQDAWEIEVSFNDGTRVLAHLLRATRLIDVALIKVDVGHPLPALPWGNSDELQVGDPVFAIGNALGVGISVSSGIVSALNRDIEDSPYDDFIQTDAAINHGNSGGPLFNMQGEVIGIDTALISPSSGSSGVGFAIPAREARVIIDRLMNYGWLRPGWIGVKIQQVTPDMSEALGIERAEGSLVSYVAPGGPAAAAGLRVGDVILHIDAAAPTDERAILRTIATTPIGENITLALWRDGKPASLTVSVHEWPRAQWETLDPPVSMATPSHGVPADLGITLGAAAQTGVLVTGVAAGTDAAQRGLVAGDVILRVQEKTVTNAAEVQAAFQAVRARKREFALVLVDPKVHEKPGPEWIVLRVSDN
jgi:serine protease Do